MTTKFGSRFASTLPPKMVFTLLTDPVHMRNWLAELVEADARPGGVFRISGPVGVSIEGTYLEVVPDRKVVFTWGGVEGVKPGRSTVEFLLERDDDGTLVRLRHYRLPQGAIETHRRGWIESGTSKKCQAAHALSSLRSKSLRTAIAVTIAGGSKPIGHQRPEVARVQ